MVFPIETRWHRQTTLSVSPSALPSCCHSAARNLHWIVWRSNLPINRVHHVYYTYSTTLPNRNSGWMGGESKAKNMIFHLSAYCTMGCLCGPHLLNTLKWIWNHLFLAGIDHFDLYTQMFKNCEPAALEGHQSWINPKPSLPPLRHWSWLRSMAWARTLFVAASDRILFDMKRWINMINVRVR